MLCLCDPLRMLQVGAGRRNVRKPQKYTYSQQTLTMLRLSTSSTRAASFKSVNTKQRLKSRQGDTTQQVWDSGLIRMLVIENMKGGEITVKIPDTFGGGLNFTRELWDISSAVFQMKNEGICQLSWS